jgi:hypothetical protein
MLTDGDISVFKFKSYLLRACCLGDEIINKYGRDAFYCFRFKYPEGYAHGEYGYSPAWQDIDYMDYMNICYPGKNYDKDAVFMSVVAMTDIERDTVLGTQVFGVIKDGVFIVLGEPLK